MFSLEVAVHADLAKEALAVRAEDSFSRLDLYPSTAVVGSQPLVTRRALFVVLAAVGMAVVSPKAAGRALCALVAVRPQKLPGPESFLAVRAGMLLIGKIKVF